MISEQDEKIFERRELLKKAYSIDKLFEIGRQLNIPYFEKLSSCWEMDEDEASNEISLRVTDDVLKQIFQKYEPRRWITFKGKYYLLADGKLSLEGSWNLVANGLRRFKLMHGSAGMNLLKAIVEGGGVIDSYTVKEIIKSPQVYEMLSDLEDLGIISASYIGEKYREWSIPREMLPIVESEVFGKKETRVELEKQATSVSKGKRRIIDPLAEERAIIERMDRELDSYLYDLIENRLEETIKFGRNFSITKLSSYLQDLFGPILYFDSLLSLTQQYGLSNAGVINPSGKMVKRTGWSLALFGDPGTGKSFATRDIILGKTSINLPAHGIPGRNRYCGGMTPARFIRVGQAYAGRTFNFIIPEFNDFFRYKGMIEPLKIAMEQGEIRYETQREVIGPYKFTSFFVVNYNVAVYKRGYKVTIQDPNFRAIEDRMLCRLHRLTKERFTEIAESQMKIFLGKMDVGKMAQAIRDHLTLIYAIETQHPLIKDEFPYKPVMITEDAYKLIAKAREYLLNEVKGDTLAFSARLEDKALSFACSASLMEYFNTDEGFIPISRDSLKYAIQIYVEEASIRSQEEFEPREILSKII
ncbi:MAG: hypothetical protein QXJ19_02645 [Candidatus Bathyarchaeia archaeon]|nr:hypothetical protein [Candidatus Bathyarchaeota archaeon]